MSLEGGSKPAEEKVCGVEKTNIDGEYFKRCPANADKLLLKDKLKTGLKKMRGLITKGAYALINAVYPEDNTCDVCGKELVADTRYRICAACIEKMPRNDGKVCLICGVPIKNEADYCIKCQNVSRPFDLCRAPLIYDGKAKEMILKMKYGGVKCIASTLAAMMADTYIAESMNADIIVFVPMSRGEEKKRGFNQSEIIAYRIAERLKLPILPALIKNRDTSLQKSLTARERAENLEGAFACVYSEVKGLNVLLIDDVFTTGATTGECAKVLLKSKAKSVKVLAAAITPLKLFTEEAES